MPGPIMTASNATKAYKGKGVKSEGGQVSLKNSSGKRVKVYGNAKSLPPWKRQLWAVYRNSRQKESFKRLYSQRQSRNRQV